MFQGRTYKMHLSHISTLDRLRQTYVLIIPLETNQPILIHVASLADNYVHASLAGKLNSLVASQLY